MSTPVSSAEGLFRDDVNGAAFSVGADRGYWRLCGIEWPFAIIEVAAASRPGAPDWYAARFQLDSYPSAPRGQLWDVDANTPLPHARWPTGGRCTQAFNPDWLPDQLATSAIYLPTDAAALVGHDAWLVQHPAHVWDNARDITQYLALLRELLTEEGYTGVRG